MESKVLTYFAHAQDDLNLRISRMFEGTFSLAAAHLGFFVFCEKVVQRIISVCLSVWIFFYPQKRNKPDVNNETFVLKYNALERTISAIWKMDRY